MNQYEQNNARVLLSAFAAFIVAVPSLLALPEGVWTVACVCFLACPGHPVIGTGQRSGPRDPQMLAIDAMVFVANLDPSPDWWSYTHIPACQGIVMPM